MFKTLEVGEKISNQDFEEQALVLRQKLLNAQFASNYPVIILIAGLDGAGKGSVVHRLNEWMDPRGIDTNAFWVASDEEDSRPYYWRFWRALPRKGEIGIFFGSWYNAPLAAARQGKLNEQELSNEGEKIVQFEEMWSADGGLIIKLWFHISRQTQFIQLSEDAPTKKQNLRVPADAQRSKADYKKVVDIAQQLIQLTDTAHSPWSLIEAEDGNYRDITVGETVLSALLGHCPTQPTATSKSAEVARNPDNQAAVMRSVDLSLSLNRSLYKQELRHYQSQLQDLAWQCHSAKRSVIAVFEGWDAAGKGSAIRRVTNAIDPRLYKLVQFAAPTDEEHQHHYLWRFWRQLQRDGRSTIFDRSWYGRVLVERVEQIASRPQWQRAYDEINQFEQQLVDHGSSVVKFWLHISSQEQLRRFKERGGQPHKRHKITEEDWRNRDRWQDYERAIDEMVTRTSTEHAPWTLIAANDKRFARIQVLKIFCSAMEQTLNRQK